MKRCKEKVAHQLKVALSTQYYAHNTQRPSVGEMRETCVTPAHTFNRLKNIDANKNQYADDVRGGRRMQKRKKLM